MTEILLIVTLTNQFTSTHRKTPIYTHTQAYCHVCLLWPWPLTSVNKRINSQTMAYMSAKIYEDQEGLVSIMFTSLVWYWSIVSLTVDLWPTTSIGSILSLRLTCMSSLMKKHTTVYSLSLSLSLSLLSTRLFPYTSIVTLTFDLQNIPPWGPGG